MKFIVIEGLDGAGKSTQLKFLQQYFIKNNLNFKFIHFPRFDSPVYGELISKFLRGDLGDLQSVNPYLVALLYAGDRNNYKQTINRWLEKKFYVLADRYVFSNIAFQCAKVIGEQQQDDLKRWILDTEYNYFQIPVPDITIFLDVPISIIKERLNKKRKGEDRKYLAGKDDIHEKNVDFQKYVYSIYNKLLNTENNFFRINCSIKEALLSQEIIHEKILDILIKNNIL